jgi:hypothetical protein
MQIYGDVPNGHPAEKPSIKMGEIIGVNPNSKASLKVVLAKLSEQAGIGKEREWVRIGFDGVPYRMVDNIIKTHVVCDVCGAEVDLSKMSFVLHVETNHPGMMDIGHKLLYGHLLLVPRAGHIEKNFLLAIFKLCRYVFLEYLANCLGFRSKRAKDFALGCSNHHVAWQMLTISLEALARELLYVYVQDCQQRDIQPTTNGFSPWREKEVFNPNFNLIHDIVFNLLLGLKCYRSGIRRNNTDYALAGRQKVAPIMYLGKHAIYQQLLLTDMKIRVEAPEEVRDYIRRNEAFSRTGDSTRGEGGDYVTEAENRTLKNNLPPGVPTEESWRVASRLDRHLKKLRTSVFERARIKDPNLEMGTTFQFEQEIQMFRSRIRVSGLLDNPRLLKPLQSIQGKKLDPDLVNFYFAAKENYKNYKLGVETGKQALFVTPEERVAYDDIENKTIKEIEAATMEQINSFPDPDAVHEYKSLFDLTMKGRGKKADYIAFHMQVKEELDRQLLDISAETSNDHDD